MPAYEILERLIKNRAVLLLIGFLGLASSGVGLYLSYSTLGLKGANVLLAGDTAPEQLELLADTSEEIFVYISGAVIKPGVYGVPSDGRLRDVLRLAGGLNTGADAVYVNSTINLASKLSDAQHIHIPWKGETVLEVPEEPSAATVGRVPSSIPSVIPSNTSANSTININSCSKNELLDIKGIGETYADKIIQNRPFTSIEELSTKLKLPKAVVEYFKLHGAI